MPVLHRLLISLLLLPALALAAPPGKSAVATAHPLATEAGQQIMATGGNAFDAAVAVSAVLAVVEPYSSGIGGGGFWLLHRKDGHEVVVDGRESAPGRAQRDMFLDEQGEPVPGLSMDGPLAAGIPGEPAALAHIARHYGKLPLAVTLAPAIKLAREGFPVTAHYRTMAEWRHAVLLRDPEAAATFLQAGAVPQAGTIIRQPQLAATLQTLAEHGAEGFYRGRVAQAMVDAVQAAGGIWTMEDLAGYRVIERTPLKGRYGDYTITSVPPPSSGGVALITMLNTLQEATAAFPAPYVLMMDNGEELRPVDLSPAQQADRPLCVLEYWDSRPAAPVRLEAPAGTIPCHCDPATGRFRALQHEWKDGALYLAEFPPASPSAYGGLGETGKVFFMQ